MTLFTLRVNVVSPNLVSEACAVLCRPYKSGMNVNCWDVHKGTLAAQPAKVGRGNVPAPGSVICIIYKPLLKVSLHSGRAIGAVFDVRRCRRVQSITPIWWNVKVRAEDIPRKQRHIGPAQPDHNPLIPFRKQ